MAALFCHPGKARIIARDPYTRQYVNRRGFSKGRAAAAPFTFKQWDAAIAYCRSKGLDDIDFLLTFPGHANAVCFRLRQAEPHPWVDYASLV